MNLMALNAAIASVAETLSLQQLRVLLAVAAKPGLSVNELATETGLTQPVASRTLGVLLGRYANEQGKPLSLLEQGISPEDPRKRAHYLSPSGTRFLQKLNKAMSSARS